MKKAVLLLAGILFTLTSTAQQTKVTIGNNVIVRDAREVANFNKLDISGSFEVRLIKGKAGKVIIEGEKNLTGLIVTDVKDNVLTIAPQQGQLFKSSKGNKIIIKVPFDTLHNLTFTGSGLITGKKVIKDNISINLTGSGKINLKVAAGTVHTNVKGAGDVVINGSTKVFECVVSGPGVVNAQGLQSTSVNVSVTGSGKANVYSVDAITGSISGSGHIAYSGQPKEKDLRRTGTGEFRILD